MHETKIYFNYCSSFGYCDTLVVSGEVPESVKIPEKMLILTKAIFPFDMKKFLLAKDDDDGMDCSDRTCKNKMEYTENMELQIDGVEPGESSEDVLAKYMAYMIPALLARASHPVLYGSAASTAMDIMNADGMGTWTAGAGMRYRSRRDMLDISTNPAFSSSHEFKIAAMRKTIAFPIDPWVQLGDPRLVLGLLLGLLGCGLSWREAARQAN